MAINENKITWKQVFNQLDSIYIKALSFEENQLLDYLITTKCFIYNTIHNYLYNLGTTEAENDSRTLVKYVIAKLLPITEKKVFEYAKKKEKDKIDYEKFNKWLDLKDDLYALASYRSLMHFALYMETQDDDSQKVWCYIMQDVMGGIFYYANAMILNHTYTNLIKQCPTGYGKSKSDCDIISYIFGVNPNATIMKVVGNPTVVAPCFDFVVNMMLSPKYGKVFPYYGKFNGAKDEMFSTCKTATGTFKINGSKQSVNYLVQNKKTPFDGSRYNYQFYDDVTQSLDKDNVNAHKWDIDRYTTMWEKRKFDEFSVCRFFTGTAYHREDFISWIRKTFANGKQLTIDKTTKNYKWAKFVKLNDEQNSVYISVPKLADLELGEDKAYCTFPQKYSKHEALKMAHGTTGKRRDFYAMEQQTPLPNESQAFDWIFLQQYETLPKEIKEGKYIAKAIIDDTRFGNDNFSCLIFKKIADKKSEDKRWYLTDCVYRPVANKVGFPLAVDRILYHKVQEIYFETNVGDPEENLNKCLKEKGETKISLSGFYSTQNKEEKISQNRDSIRDNIVFPKQGMYNEESEMGKCMSDIVNYSFEYKNKHDDGIDCCAMFVMQEEEDGENEIEILDFSL